MAHTQMKAEDALELVYRELVSIWAYLITYVECFASHDVKRNRLLDVTAPGFFSLVQSALAECILMRIARLMDPPKDKRLNINVSFPLVMEAEWGGEDPKPVLDQWASIREKWEHGGYKALKNIRNKALAHNDWDSFGDGRKVSTRLTERQISDLRSLFTDLWKLMADARYIVTGTSTSEPNFGEVEHLPTEVFKYLKYGLFHFQTDRSWSEFEYANVGSEHPIRLVDW